MYLCRHRNLKILFNKQIRYMAQLIWICLGDADDYVLHLDSAFIHLFSYTRTLMCTWASYVTTPRIARTIGSVNRNFDSIKTIVLCAICRKLVFIKKKMAEPFCGEDIISLRSCLQIQIVSSFGEISAEKRFQWKLKSQAKQLLIAPDLSAYYRESGYTFFLIILFRNSLVHRHLKCVVSAAAIIVFWVSFW